MKASVKDITNLIKVANFTNKPESNSATLNDRQIIVTYIPNEKYPFFVKVTEGQNYKTALFCKSEVTQVRDIWNEFIEGYDINKTL